MKYDPHHIKHSNNRFIIVSSCGACPYARLDYKCTKKLCTCHGILPKEVDTVRYHDSVPEWCPLPINE